MKSVADRCRAYRRRILDLSQHVNALHIGGAFSSVEIVDCVYNELGVRPGGRDIFLMSKGHAGILQYVVLESLGVLSADDLAGYCTAQGRLGVHPEHTTHGIAAATGSLGHGLPIAVGMALADRDATVYVLISDGELQEGSTWEAMMLASSLKLGNLVVFVDSNDLQSFGRTSETHPSFYPISEKARAFGWESVNCDGHGSDALRCGAKLNQHTDIPLMVIAKTTKGKGVSFMEDVPMWHYRSPSPAEYAVAIAEIEARP